MPTRFNIWWSIYVRCSDMQKFRRVHLPAVEALIGAPEMGWEIVRERDNPTETRLVGYTNHEVQTKNEGAALFLELAGRLYAGRWALQGLSTLSQDADLYLYAQSSVAKQSHEPPALTELLVELRSGWVTRTPDGWELPESSAF